MKLKAFFYISHLGLDLSTAMLEQVSEEKLVSMEG